MNQSDDFGSLGEVKAVATELNVPFRYLCRNQCGQHLLLNSVGKAESYRCVAVISIDLLSMCEARKE